jgi:antitoxin component YwqK of YwqJK toxin-antitoxin module
LKKQNATHVILDNWYKHAYTTLYPAIQANPEKFKVLKQIGKPDTINQLNPTYILEFNDEWGYHGERIDGKKSGEGYELFQDGRKYVGYFEDGLPNGNGTLFDPTGEVIAKGRWRNGVFVGENK